MKTALLILAAAGVVVSGCSSGETEQLKRTTIPSYDKQTGRLTELTFDLNKNGTIDTWTQMDGARPVLTKTDRNEDGKIDRWEYFNAAGQLEKVGFSRKDDGKPDAWAFAGPDGKVNRIEVSSTADIDKVDRWEHYDQRGLVSAEEDSNGDGKPDRRVTYRNGVAVMIETDPDPAGHFTKRQAIKHP